MIYRDNKGVTIEGTWNKTNKFTANRHVMIFGENGLTDVETYLRDTPRKWTVKQGEDDCLKSQSWDLNAGWAKTREMIKDGWREGAENLDTRLQAIMPAAGREARWGYAQSGSSVRVGRYLTGHPKNMRSRRKHNMGSAPVFHIVINGNASCMVNAEQMANYGTALVGLIDRLENTGKRCHVDVMYALNENGTRVSVGWNVKRASEPVDLAAIAFSIAHPAAFRRVGFSLIERTPRECENYGYGYCADILEDDVFDAQAGTMLVDGINHEPKRCNSPKDALRLAIEQLNKAAVLAGHTTPDQPLIDDEAAEMFLY